jgi:hypothetical protein
MTLVGPNHHAHPMSALGPGSGHCFGGRDMAQRVHQHEVMDRAIMANRRDVQACLFQLSGAGLALIAMRSFSAVTTGAGGGN